MIFENWIQKANGNLIQFLAGLDVVSNTKVAETALKHFFYKLPNMLNNNFKFIWRPSKCSRIIARIVDDESIRKGKVQCNYIM